MSRLLAHEAFVPDLHPQGIEEADRVDRLERAGLPSGEHLQNRVGRRADQIERDLDAIEIAQVPDDLGGAHAAGVRGDDLLVEGGKAALVRSDGLRVKGGVPITRHGHRQQARVGSDGLAAAAVAAVADLRLAGETMVHLGLHQHSLHWSESKL